MMPDLNVALASVFRSNGSLRDQPSAIRRTSTPYATTFPCEVVTCRLHDGRIRLFCKYGTKNGACSYGQRRGVNYEAAVYRHVLGPSRVSTPTFYGSYTDPNTGGTWLILEYMKRSLRAGKVPERRAMKLAARWIGHFHAANETRVAESSLSFLIHGDAAWYRGWCRRALRSARRYGLRLPWLAAVSGRLEEEIASLAALPRTIIHGEYYPHNIMFQAGVVRPVDWETAAIAPGEIDVATLTEGWSRSEMRDFEAEYQQARWPHGSPDHFGRNLDLARAYVQVRWLGDDDPKKSMNMTRWNLLRDVSKRLQLIPKGCA